MMKSVDELKQDHQKQRSPNTPSASSNAAAERKTREDLLEKYRMMDLHSMSQNLSAVLNDPREDTSILNAVADWWFTDSTSEQMKQQELQQQQHLLLSLGSSVTSAISTAGSKVLNGSATTSRSDGGAKVVVNDAFLSDLDTMKATSGVVTITEPRAYSSSHFSRYVHDISPIYASLEEARKSIQVDKQQPKQKIDPYKVVTMEKGVPEVFFHEDFNLANADIFDQVFQKDAMAASLLLQEKLAHYLDEVEILLLRQVTYRSTGIFDALMQYNDLNDQLCAGLPYVRNLRKKIHDLQDISVRRPLSITKLMRKRSNLIQLSKLMDSVSSVYQSVNNLQLLVSRSDYVSAIDLIEETQLILKSDLSGLSCFRSLSQQLKEELKAMETKMQQEFILITVESDIEELKSSEKIENTQFYLHLMPVIHGLARMNYIQPALQTFREELIRYAKEITKETLEKSLGRMEQPKFKMDNADVQKLKKNASNLNLSPNNIQQLTSISHDNFLRVVSDIFEALYSVIVKTSYVSDIITQFCEESDNTKFVNNVRQSNLKAEIEKVFENVCEVCHTRCSTIFTFRNNEIKRMRKKEIVQYMNKAFEFIEKCEQLLGKKISTLRGTLIQQGQIYLDEFKSQKLEVLRDVLDKEKWVPIETIAPEFQASLLSLTSESGTVNENTTDEEADVKFLMLDGHKFPTCWSFLMLVKIINEYMEMVSSDYNFISGFELSQGVHKLLVEFNSRTRNLVLNAKAVNEVTQLTSITAKHILLASECLHTLIYLVPHLLKKLESKLEGAQKRLLKFDDLLRTLKSHQDELKNKIYALMQDRVKDQTQAGVKFPWDVVAPDQKTPIHGVARDLAYLLKISEQFLGTHQKDQIDYLTNIIRMFFDKLKNLIEGLRNKVKTKSGKDRLRKEITQFRHLLNLEPNRGKYSSEIDIFELEKLYEQCFGSANAN